MIIMKNEELRLIKIEDRHSCKQQTLNINDTVSFLRVGGGWKVRR